MTLLPEMSSMWEGVQDFVFNPDYENKNVVRSNYLAPAICMAYYLVTTYIGPHVMKNRKPYNLKNVIVLYNALMVILNFYVAYGYVSKAGRLVTENLCTADPHSTYYEVAKAVKPYTWLFLMMKYAEFLDSIFFVMRKRFHLLTFLHRAHHALVPVVALIFLRNSVSICAYFAVIFNATVHVIMYFYYGLSACGPGFRKYLWWKRYLTTLQIVQFLANISCLLMNFLTGCFPITSSEILLTYFYGFLLILFLNYFIRQRCKGEDVGSPKKANGIPHSSPAPHKHK